MAAAPSQALERGNRRCNSSREKVGEVACPKFGLTLPHRALTRFSIEDEGCVSRGELSQARYGWVGPPEAGGKN